MAVGAKVRVELLLVSADEAGRPQGEVLDKIAVAASDIFGHLVSDGTARHLSAVHSR
ncbi:hypothetical protein OH799_03345 [Nocardia sp. NBC_00881]|uniref:hypothetical protein n=1 Tax=Nocardia sp. NBC_00881 TaxID=2975995 RepID=UPI0038670562|nr:hypothetical protein OH799_03345 [Nocardia sp. NBC_00881]